MGSTRGIRTSMDHAALFGAHIMRLPPSETVRAARVLITSPYCWTQNARARVADGNRCSPGHPDAVVWSLNGALSVVSNPRGHAPVFLLRSFDRLVRELGLVKRLWPETHLILRDENYPCIWESVDDFNDDRTHSEVLELMDTASSWLKEYGY